MKQSAVVALLLAAIAVEWLCCLGLITMRNPNDRLHVIAPANILPPVLLSCAVFIETGFSHEVVKMFLIAGTMILSSPIVSHVFARAAWWRKRRSREK